MILMCAGIAVLVFLGLRAAFLSLRPQSAPLVAGPVDDSVVALADGSILIAKPGTISRALIDWFDNPAAPPKTFDIGWAPFEPNSVEPTPESQVRLDRFATELRANPDVEANVIVCTTMNDAGEMQLASRRAVHLQQLLVDKRIERERINASTCHLRNARVAAASQSAQNGEVIDIRLSRGSSL